MTNQPVACPHAMGLPLSCPNPSSGRVYKEECTRCFGNADASSGGLDVCLQCFNGGCHGGYEHSRSHCEKSGHVLYVNIRREEVEGGGEEREITKVAIGVEGGAQGGNKEYVYDTRVCCYACGDVEIDVNQGNIPAVVEAIMQAPSALRQDELKAWEEEIVSCVHTRECEQVEGSGVGEEEEEGEGENRKKKRKLIEKKSLAKCFGCELESNLWLCLVCGQLSCGRKNYDGSGGNGHALEHFQATGHAVNCKLGTITPEGQADIFCYACDETRLDPLLSQHLHHFGIEVSDQRTTEKSTKELELDQNLSLDFSMTTEDGKPLQPVYGPGLTGIRNLGNTCYMASVLQVLFTLPGMRRRYEGFAHQQACTAPQPAQCFSCQMEKFANGLLDGRYSMAAGGKKGSSGGGDEDLKAAVEEGQCGINPGMFKSLVGRDHPEFSTMRQQDALEFFQFLCSQIEMKERTRDPPSPEWCFDFNAEERLQCTECAHVRYKTIKNCSVSVPIVGTALMDCISEFSREETVDFNCPQCKKSTKTNKVTKFSSTPEILVVCLKRFVYEDWVPKKLTTNLEVPDKVDLGSFIGTGANPDEMLMPEDNNNESSGASGPAVDEGALSQLLSMGFPEVRCRKALIATGNSGADMAMNWIFERMDDPDIDTPIQETQSAPAGGDNISEELVAQLCDMGFSRGHAKRALRETSSNMERAVEWLFSHPDTGEDDVPMADASAAEAREIGSTSPPNYEIIGAITHKGTSVGCGHYVAHVKKPVGDKWKWVLFNDHKVAESPDPPIGNAYLYFYRKVEQ